MCAQNRPEQFPEFTMNLGNVVLRSAETMQKLVFSVIVGQFSEFATNSENVVLNFWQMSD